jgi:ubiquinone/menaquinone biosynthesis C-methylase UbiE
VAVADPQGLTFATVAEEYERGRPGWPLAAVDRARDELGLSQSSTVLDLGAGTGKLTRVLSQYFERVIAVEPLDSLRAIQEKLVPSAESVAGSGESIPIEDHLVDAIFVAEAFHWFATDACVAEFVRVLRSAGGVALLFNLPTGEWSPAITGKAETVLEEAFTRAGPPGGPKVESGEWRKPLANSPAFGKLVTVTFDHALTLDRAGLIAHVLSISSIARMAGEDRRKLAQSLEATLPDVTFTQPLRTELHYARRI